MRRKRWGTNHLDQITRTANVWIKTTRLKFIIHPSYQKKKNIINIHKNRKKFLPSPTYISPSNTPPHPPLHRPRALRPSRVQFALTSLLLRRLFRRLPFLQDIGGGGGGGGNGAVGPEGVGGVGAEEGAGGVVDWWGLGGSRAGGRRGLGAGLEVCGGLVGVLAVTLTSTLTSALTTSLPASLAAALSAPLPTPLPTSSRRTSHPATPSLRHHIRRRRRTR